MVKLTERETEVIRLRDEEGLSWRTIAKALGASKSSVYSSYRTAAAKKTRAQKSYGQGSYQSESFEVLDIATNTEAA